MEPVTNGLSSVQTIYQVYSLMGVQVAVDFHSPRFICLDIFFEYLEPWWCWRICLLGNWKQESFIWQLHSTYLWIVCFSSDLYSPNAVALLGQWYHGHLPAGLPHPSWELLHANWVWGWFMVMCFCGSIWWHSCFFPCDPYPYSGRWTAYGSCKFFSAAYMI